MTRDLVLFKQYPGLCGAILVYDCLWGSVNENFRALLEELFYYMGYTIMLTSHKATYDERQQATGITPFMTLTNRRTINKIYIYFKRLHND